MEGNYAATVAAVSLFSKFVERNARDTKMTTRMPEGTRRESSFLFSGAALVSRSSMYSKRFRRKQWPTTR